MVLVTIDHNRYMEWRALYDYLYEHWEELEVEGKMRALVLCLQRHWQKAVIEIPEDF